MKVVTTRAELAAARAELVGPVGLVPTMGALHAGHQALIHQATTGNPAVVVSIFVNPLQFSPTEDLDRYPRTFDDDLAMCADEGVAVVFAPAPITVYPDGPPQVTIDAGPLGTVLEGASRPGHFAGVLTVVTKLFTLVRPDVAYFGEKDYQQLVLIRRLVHDLDLGVRIAAVPTVREPDGLARSSRNRYLSPVDRQAALALSRALRAGAEAAEKGPDAVLGAANVILIGQSDVDVDYLEVRAPDLGPAPTTGEARLLVAARVGRTRLIDNVAIHLGES